MTVTTSFRALGTTAVVAVADPGRLVQAVEVVRRCTDRLDAAASRFRADSELARLHAASAGRPVMVSDVLLDAVDDALAAARFTDGVVDPTVGRAMRELGYDRDFAAVAPEGPALPYRRAQVPGWRTIRVDRDAGTVTLPPGVQVDLGATAKAGGADTAAVLAASATGTGVLVSLGGDVAVAGRPPAGGWTVRIADRHDAGPDDPSVTVAIRRGGLATSGVTARRWTRGDRTLHHLVDPTTGRPADTCWRTVSVAAESCGRANTASTAAVVLGPAAPRWLQRHGFCARLVAVDGTVVGVGRCPGSAGGR
ncbi:MAG TPA: FAD:protein FMN transferase [Acidimicrobiales bacterium]|nr:FAD:protein FMN transferase [Acidimicrobiales bacterium]